MSYLYPLARKAVEEFPAALAPVRERLPVDDGPIGVLGGSLGGPSHCGSLPTPNSRSSPAPS